MSTLIILFYSLLSCNTQEPPIQFSETALNDKFATLEGNEIAFSDILKTHQGKDIVIDVWASWCKDCIKGMPKVRQLQKEYPNAVYLFLSLDKTDEAWKNGIKKYKVNGEHYFMKSGWKGDFGNFLDLDWIPRYMVVDKTGNIKVFKAIEADDDKLKTALQ